MTITNTWAIVQMEAYPLYEGHTDVIFNAHWTLTATDGDLIGYAYGTQALSFDPEVPFTPIDSLTEGQVLAWMHREMGEERVAQLEAIVATQIADQATPKVVSPDLPWGTA